MTRGATVERQIVISICVVLLGLLGIFAWNIQSAYRLLPANVREPMPVVPFGGWREFSSADGQYTVKFPDIAQHATDTVGQRLYDMTVAERANGTTFMVTRITFTGDDVDQTNRSLESFRDEIVASQPRSRVTEEHAARVGDHPALVFEMDNVTARSICKLFFVGDTLFMVMVISPKAFYRQEDVDYFFNSFQLHPVTKTGLP